MNNTTPTLAASRFAFTSAVRDHVAKDLERIALVRTGPQGTIEIGMIAVRTHGNSFDATVYCGTPAARYRWRSDDLVGRWTSEREAVVTEAKRRLLDRLVTTGDLPAHCGPQLALHGHS